MLADTISSRPHAGTLNGTVHKTGTALIELINFIASELPVWRDRFLGKKNISETILTSRLCAHLNSACRFHSGWDIYQFRVEEADEREPSRKIDLIAAACSATIVIEGRSYHDVDTILPIECKRLPTPKGTRRDEMEYVVNRNATTGGIQRFKAGNHGAKHQIGACKKICVNDILLMTFKGNYHGHKQQVCKRLSAITC